MGGGGGKHILECIKKAKQKKSARIWKSASNRRGICHWPACCTNSTPASLPTALQMSQVTYKLCCEWVLSQIWANRSTHMNGPCCTNSTPASSQMHCEWVMSHINCVINESCHTCEYESCHTYEWAMLHELHSRFTPNSVANESCDVQVVLCYECVVSQKWMSHGTHMNESWRTYEWVMWRTSCDMNASCHTYEWVMAHTWMSHGTHMDATYKSHTGNVQVVLWGGFGW